MPLYKGNLQNIYLTVEKVVIMILQCLVLKHKRLEDILLIPVLTVEDNQVEKSTKFMLLRHLALSKQVIFPFFVSFSISIEDQKALYLLELAT